MESYTVEYFERDTGYEVCVVYEEYDKAMSVYKELKSTDNIADIALLIRNSKRNTKKTKGNVLKSTSK
jgi:hypothetical protein